MAFLALVAIFLSLGTSSNAQLSTGYYSNTCPNLSSTVQSAVRSAITQDTRVGATLVRLFYHDCFVNGCDGSILLDDTSTFTGEKTAGPNKDSLTTKVFQVVDDIRMAVENACSGVVSCADILALAAMDSVSILGGPRWDVKLGRHDSTTASFSGANSNIPGPASSLQNLISSFSNQGLSADEMVALSGKDVPGLLQCGLCLCGCLRGCFCIPPPVRGSRPPLLSGTSFVLSSLPFLGFDLSNLLVFTPMTIEMMRKRQKIERELSIGEEIGRSNNLEVAKKNPNLASINKKFGMIHGFSSLANIMSFGCRLAMHFWYLAGKMQL